MIKKGHLKEFVVGAKPLPVPSPSPPPPRRDRYQREDRGPNKQPHHRPRSPRRERLRSREGGRNEQRDRMNLPGGEIKVISSGPSLGGESSRPRKAHIRVAQSEPMVIPAGQEANQISQACPKMARMKECYITFTEDKARRIVHHMIILW